VSSYSYSNTLKVLTLLVSNRATYYCRDIRNEVCDRTHAQILGESQRQIQTLTVNNQKILKSWSVLVEKW
jgi:hypothetical protein